MAAIGREGSSAACLRGLGGGLGAFALLNGLGELAAPGYSANFLWVSAPGPLVLAAGGLLAANAWRPLAGLARRTAGLLVLGLAAVAWLDVVRFAEVLAADRIVTPVWLPGSALVAGLLSAVGGGFLRPAGAVRRPRRGVAAVGCAAAIVGLPLLFIGTFGPTRYARSADCVVVLGAKVDDDGTPSLALADRTDEGIRLVRDGLADVLLLSGGIDPRNGHSEAQVMRARAIAAGVPPGAIVLDEAGVNSAATVRNTHRYLRQHGLDSVLVVSHYYHLPRLKLLFARTGVAASTVPARMTRRLALEPYFVAREVAAFYNSLLRETPRLLW